MLYSVNSNLPGVKSVFTSEEVAPTSSSTIIPMFPVAINNTYAQSTATVSGVANTALDVVAFTASANLAANEYAGQFVEVDFATPEVRTVSQHAATVSGATCTMYMSRPFTQACDADNTSIDIRTWEGYNIPKLYSSVNSFAEEHLEKNAAGTPNWTGSEAAYYTLSEFKANGGTLFYACPVKLVTATDTGSGLAAKLGATLTADTTFLAKMLSISPQPDLICISKQPSLYVLPAASDWAACDGAWNTYVASRSSDDTVDDSLRLITYISDTPTAVASTAVTYRATTLNSSTEKMSLYHGQYMTNSLTRGRLQAVNIASAICGLINRTSTSAPESFGHAFDGKNYMSLFNLGMVEQGLTPADRLTLISNGINPLISKPAQGSWIESQFTQKKNTSSVAADPIESLHVVIGRAKIWNGLQPILNSIISEPNVSSARSALIGRVDSYMSQVETAQIITGYTLSDVTSSADAQTGVVRFELSVAFAREVDFVELKLNASFGA